MMLFNKTTPGDKSLLSLGKARKVRGYEIERMPIGAYLSALEKFKTLPADFIAECFPGQTVDEVVTMFTRIDENTLMSLFPTLLTTAPKFLLGFISELTGIDETMLKNDSAVGLVGLVEIVTAFIEVNELGELGAAISRLIGKIRNLKTMPATGCKASSPAASASE